MNNIIGIDMPLSGIDIYKNILPKTNCGDCGIGSCFTFATMVATNQLSLRKCPHIDSEKLKEYQQKFDQQYASGTFVKTDIARDALEWAKKRSASMVLEDVAARIGGRLIKEGDQTVLELPYFSDSVVIGRDSIKTKDGSVINHWDQILIYNHMAQGGTAFPTGTWVSMQDIPNSTPKIASMKSQVEVPLAKHFTGSLEALKKAAKAVGGTEMTGRASSADLVLVFKPFPRIPLMLQFWDEYSQEGFEADTKVLFDKTISEHLDVESILFLCEHLRELLERGTV
jgi:hypothetical protein